MTAHRAGGRASSSKPVKQVTAMLNGEVVGTVDATLTVGQASLKIAGEHGVRAFNVKLNGKKVTTVDSNKPLSGVKTLEIVTKDARG